MKKLFKIMFTMSLLLTLSFYFVLNYSNAMELTKQIDTKDTNNLKTFNEPIDYTETLDTFDNPERGFYSHLRYNFKVSGNEEPENYRLEGNLLHLRLGIGDFSGKVNKNKDLEFSQDMLNMLDNILKKIKENGGTAIVRFAYDNFEGDENLEPSLDMILKHIEQICPILTENKDVISYVELGFFGPWGEMHSSDISTPANVTKALNLMLANTPEEIKIGVRQPKYYVDFAGIDRAKLNENITVKGTKEYRVGLFNDGYLGSHSDLGTFENREIEISWLENQALHTLYGGEIVSTRGNEENDKLNTAEYMSKEAFRTHTTYLNSEYDENVINAWKKETYNGDDELYKGKDGYLYIANHMGYRFVLRNSNINSLDNKINLALDLENVGFANLVNSKKVSIILENDSKKYEFVTDLDPTAWNTKNTSKLNLSISVPDDFEETEYNVYIRISKYGDYLNDSNYQCIRLANNNIWNETLGANYIGQFVYNKENKTDPPASQDPNNNQDNDNHQNTDNNILDNNTDNQNTDNSVDNSQNNNTLYDNNNQDTNTLHNNADNQNTNNSQNNINNNTLHYSNKTQSINDDPNIVKNISYYSSNKDDTVSPNAIPYTGKTTLIFMIILSSISAIYFFKKLL